ncbi:MAG: PspC domain-containing protein [Lachnospiraceae bacterium]|nr:PspC domain-containing protein [Lachnospiraceae bacterium]
MNNKKLMKSAKDCKICGVCGGIAEYLELDSTIVRLITLLLIFGAGVSIWVYIIAALVIPKEVPELTVDYQYDNDAF